LHKARKKDRELLAVDFKKMYRAEFVSSQTSLVLSLHDKPAGTACEGGEEADKGGGGILWGRGVEKLLYLILGRLNEGRESEGSGDLLTRHTEQGTMANSEMERVLKNTSTIS
jgi:hypothetical protein